MIRLRSLLAALALLMLFAQQGAITHAFTHVAEQLQQHDKHHPSPADNCEQCAAYAGVLGGMPASPPALIFLEQPVLHAVDQPQPHASRSFLAYRSRAPPRTLA